jgi:hypothetical protein
MSGNEYTPSLLASIPTWTNEPRQLAGFVIFLLNERRSYFINTFTAASNCWSRPRLTAPGSKGCFTSGSNCWFSR